MNGFRPACLENIILSPSISCINLLNIYELKIKTEFVCRGLCPWGGQSRQDIDIRGRKSLFVSKKQNSHGVVLALFFFHM